MNLPKLTRGCKWYMEIKESNSMSYFFSSNVILLSIVSRRIEMESLFHGGGFLQRQIRMERLVTELGKEKVKMAKIVRYIHVIANNYIFKFIMSSVRRQLIGMPVYMYGIFFWIGWDLIGNPKDIF